MAGGQHGLVVVDDGVCPDELAGLVLPFDPLAGGEGARLVGEEDFGADVVLRVDDAEKAECVLREKGVSTLNEDDIKDI